MVLRKYCLIVMGAVGNTKDYVKKVSDNKPKFISGGDALVTTFISGFTVNELTDIFKKDDVALFIFELDETKSCISIGKENLHNHLLSDLVINDKLWNFIKNENKSESPLKEPKPEKRVESTLDIDESINSLLDKGIDNLSSEDFNKLETISLRLKDSNDCLNE